MSKAVSPFLNLVNWAMAATPLVAVLAYALLPVIR
jgi:hypothetical protein